MTPGPTFFRKVAKGLNRLGGYGATALWELFSIRTPSNPLVTVVIATFNRPENLRVAIESVLRQSYRDLEILVVGDACTDNTEQVVRSVRDSRVQWHSLGRNSGSQSLPNNLGIAKARGKYIAYLGHDDIWLPNHLSVLVRAMEYGRLNVATTRCLIVGPEGSNALFLSGPGLVDTQGITPPPSSLCHTRDIVEIAGNWTDYKLLPANYAPDAEFIDRLKSASTRKRALRRLTVIKFYAAWRKDVYINGDNSEQSRWLELAEKPRWLVLRVTAKLFLLSLRRIKASVPTENLDLRPGEHLVDAWRRIKGLPKR